MTRYRSRRKYRCGGSSIITNLLGRAMVRDNVQKLINTVSKPNITQKLADAVVNGSANALKAGTQKGIEEAASLLKASAQKGVNSIVNKKKNRQAIKKAIEKLTVGGGGRVYD